MLIKLRLITTFEASIMIMIVQQGMYTTALAVMFNGVQGLSRYLARHIPMGDCLPLSNLQLQSK